MATTSIAAPAAWRVEILALQGVVAIFLGLRLYANLNMDLLGDEAYYWMWGQHLSWSYFDHPPLVVRLSEERRRIALAQIGALFDEYRSTMTADRRVLLDRYSLVDIASKVVGVGSVHM